ncbi:MAG: maleate cis-trans isomerase family protein [Alphaproteobacteria bacterium]
MSQATPMSQVTSLPRTRPTSVPATLDRGSGTRARIGLIALAGDATVEPDFRALGLAPDITLHVSRVPSLAVTVENLLMTARGLTQATALVLPGQRLDVLAYACTSGTVVAGVPAVIAAIRAARPGIAVTTPITAALAGFQRLGVHRVAVLTPYVEEVNAPVVSYLEANGIDVVDIASFNLLAEDEMCRVVPEAIAAAAEGLDHRRADALFISCTALRALGLIDRLEGRLGKPVLSSNHALYWHALRLAGVMDPVPGFGRLMRLSLGA